MAPLLGAVRAVVGRRRRVAGTRGFPLSARRRTDAASAATAPSRRSGRPRAAASPDRRRRRQPDPDRRNRWSARPRRVCLIVHCRGSRTLLERRIAERRRAGRDPSEADASVLARQLAEFIEPVVVEADGLVVLDADAPLSPEEAAAAVRATV